MATKLTGNSANLNKHDSIILSSILKRLNDTTVESFSQTEVWTLLERVLADHSTIVTDFNSNKAVCPAIILMNQVKK